VESDALVITFFTPSKRNDPLCPFCPATGQAAPDRHCRRCPGNLTIDAVGATDVQISSDPSTDDKRVRNDTVTLDGVKVVTNRATRHVETGLSAGTTYTIGVSASDGRDESAQTLLLVTTLELPPSAEPPPGEPPLGGAQPAGWSLVFNDDFDGSGDASVGAADSNWRFESLADGLRRGTRSGCL